MPALSWKTGATALSLALLIANTASAQNYGYNGGGRTLAGHHNQGAYYGGQNFGRPQHSSPRNNQRARSKDRNAEVAIGALVVGGILGYAISQSNSQSQANYQTPPAAYYPAAPNAAVSGGNYGGYVDPYYAGQAPVQSGVVTSAAYAQPTYATAPTPYPQYTQPQAYQAPAAQTMEYVDVNGRRYYRATP